MIADAGAVASGGAEAQDLSDAVPVFIGRTGVHQRLRNAQYRWDKDTKLPLDPSGKGVLDPVRLGDYVARKDGTRYAYAGRHGSYGQQRNARVQWHIRPACASLCDEAAALSFVESSLRAERSAYRGIGVDLLLLMYAEDATRLRSVYDHALRFVGYWSKRQEIEVSPPALECAVTDAIVGLLCPGSRNGEDVKHKRRMRRPSVRSRAAELGMDKDLFLAMRNAVSRMLNVERSMAIAAWVSVSRTNERDIYEIRGTNAELSIFKHSEAANFPAYHRQPGERTRPLVASQ